MNPHYGIPFVWMKSRTRTHWHKNMIKFKKHFYLLITTLAIICMHHLANAQISEPEYRFKGPVKTMRLTKTDYGKPPKELITFFEYDKQGRKIKEVSPYSTSSEFYYTNEKTQIPALQKSFNKADGKEQSFNVLAYNSAGKKLLSGEFSHGSWQYFYMYDHALKATEEKMFSRNEIYNRKTTQSIDLSSFTIPNGFAPFDWDKNLSRAWDEKSFGYAPKNYEHKLFFELVEKGNPKNKVTYSYQATDAYDAGKGYWYWYKNDKKIEERYIYNAKDISDFGHRYTYDTQGRLLSDTYGYYHKMPSGFMQKTTYQYNAQGDLLKRTEVDADAKNPAPYVINYTYTYDNRNNWTSCKSLFKDGSGSTIKRVFSYYQSGEASAKNSIGPTHYTAALQLLQQNKAPVSAQYNAYLQAKQNQERNPVPKSNDQALSTSRWQDFIPKRQVLDTSASGDLNKDGLIDMVIVYQPEKLLKNAQNTERTLRILFAQPNGEYRLAVESKGVVADESMNNVFFTGVEISKGILVIDNEFLRGGCTHKYRYQNGSFYLIGASRLDGDASYTSSIDYNLSTGKYIHEYKNYNPEENKNKSFKKEGILKLNPLPDIKTFSLFSLKVADAYL
jgi:hypothetical protein